MSSGGGWPAKYPWRLLPQGGIHPFVPPRPDWLKRPPRGPQGGYVDADSNEWVPHPSPTGDVGDFHWDVQHPSGLHTNIRQDGELDHGEDNF